MSKGLGWSLFFGIVLMATFLIWFVSPAYGWWLPENVSSYGGSVDFLFYLILAMTAFFFVLTEVVLVYAMWRFEYKEGTRSTYTHGNHILEMVWSGIPAVLLLFIAFVQIPAWSEMKISAWDRIRKPSTAPPPDVAISVSARQWEWRMRYPAKPDSFVYNEKDDADEILKKQKAARGWAEIPEADDMHVPNEIHCYVNANVKVYLRTMDVLHSFTIPNLRLKQDTLPGKTIPVWFKAEKANCKFDPSTGKVIDTAGKRDAWEIACQELCGGRHYAMRGRLYVHESPESFNAWVAHMQKAGKAREPEKVAQGN